ncbi:hypothetical protein [Sphingobacterium litopenaei]|nr:hypothetical protein [Sphingobacterium litopenaei]
MKRTINRRNKYDKLRSNIKGILLLQDNFYILVWRILFPYNGDWNAL